MSRHTYDMTKQYQQGSSVYGLVFAIFAIAVFIKLGLSIVPAQIDDYQLTKSVAMQLKRSNDNQESSEAFMRQLKTQLSVNPAYNNDLEDMLTLTNKEVGSLKVYKEYEVASNFVSNIYIVSHFEGDITADDAIN